MLYTQERGITETESTELLNDIPCDGIKIISGVVNREFTGLDIIALVRRKSEIGQYAFFDACFYLLCLSQQCEEILC